MKLPKMWKVMGAAIAVSVILATLFGAGILAKGNETGHGNSLSVTADTVYGFLGAPSPVLICVESNRFSPGQEIVWRVVAGDENGNPMDNTKLQSVVVKVPGDVTLNATYGAHPVIFDGEDHFWTAVWTIPDGYRTTGTLPYRVVATASNGLGKGTFGDSTSILILSP